MEADYSIHSEISYRQVVAPGSNDKYKAGPNNGMHPTRDTAALIFHNGPGGRVMPGVMPLSRSAQSVLG
jgi:hypothetical protein